MRKKILSMICILAILASNLTLTGAGLFAGKSVTLDPTAMPAYHSYSIEEINTDLKGNSKQLETKYKNRCISTVGIVTSVSDNGVKLTLKDSGKGTGTVTANATNKDVIGQIAALKNGQKVKVFGVSKLALFRKSISIDAHAVKLTNDEADNTRYEFINGKAFSTRLSESRSLGNGKMKYMIPSEWAGVETKLTNVEGYQYSVNEIASGFKTDPEQVYVYYFDNEKYLKNLTDKDKTDEIEKAIVKNILKNESIPALGFPTKKVTADYGTVFSFYDTSFIDSGRKSHNVEFVFTPAGNKGICCILYIFNESNHKEDVIYLMRTIQAEK